MVVARGGVHWVDFGPVVDSAPAKRRPVVIVQSDHFNATRLATVIICPLTSKTDRAELPGNVFVPASASGLPKDSVANVTQLMTLDRASLTPKVSQLPAYLLAEIDAGILIVLGLHGRVMR